MLAWQLISEEPNYVSSGSQNPTTYTHTGHLLQEMLSFALYFTVML